MALTPFSGITGRRLVQYRCSHCRQYRNPVLARFMSHVRVTRGCWAWIGKNRAGYGRFWLNGMVSAHRWAFQFFNRELKPQEVVDHLCSNRSCVNPQHLDATSTAENNRRALAKRPRQLYCLRGHRRTIENLKKNRSCKLCEYRRAARRSR